MSQKQESSNIIQFPGRKKEEEIASTSATTMEPQPVAKAAVAVAQAPRKRGISMKAGAGFVAIALMTVAVNRYTFNQKVETLDASSNSSISRTIASVERVNWTRDADWEKKVAESLASAQERDLASTGIGHSPTMEEKLRWGTLGENYTYVFRPDVHLISQIELQDDTSNPAYVLDRSRFLNDYGRLLDSTFASASLKSVEVSHDKTIESYTLFDKDKRPKGEARFELDNHKRLLSLKVAPVQI